MDVAVRELDAHQLASLAELAREAGRQFDIRLGANEVLARLPPDEPEPATAAGEPEFRRFVEKLPLGTYLIQDGRYRYANPKLAEILGYTQPELVGSDVATLVVDGDRPTVLGRIREGLAGEAPAPYTFRAIRKDGELIDVEVHETVDRDRRPGRAHRLAARRHRPQARRGPGRRARLRRPA